MAMAGQGYPGVAQAAQSQLPQELQSLLGGVSQGKAAAQGMMPSASQPMGAPQATDDLAPVGRQATDYLNRFSAALQSRGDEKNAHVIAKCAYTVQGVVLDRQQKIQDLMQAQVGAQPAATPTGFQ
jgi:hypothetical protein